MLKPDIGALVVLKSGGPVMTVSGQPTSGNWIPCTWFDASGPAQMANFHSEALEPATEKSKTCNIGVLTKQELLEVLGLDAKDFSKNVDQKPASGKPKPPDLRDEALKKLEESISRLETVVTGRQAFEVTRAAVIWHNLEKPSGTVAESLLHSKVGEYIETATSLMSLGDFLKMLDISPTATSIAKQKTRAPAKPKTGKKR